MKVTNSKILKVKFVVIVGIVLISNFTFGQEENIFTKHHNVSLLLGHTYVSQGFVENKREWLILPSVAFDYNFVFSEKWAIGLHNDLIFENYKIEKDDEQFERSTPIASAITGGFKPGEHFTYQFGLGGEFAKEENFFLTRFGVEYSLELPKEWELISNFVYDIKWNAYDSFGLSIGISKSFGE
jgi:hypothetical protein